MLLSKWSAFAGRASSPPYPSIPEQCATSSLTEDHRGVGGHLEIAVSLLYSVLLLPIYWEKMQMMSDAELVLRMQILNIVLTQASNTVRFLKSKVS